MRDQPRPALVGPHLLRRPPHLAAHRDVEHEEHEGADEVDDELGVEERGAARLGAPGHLVDRGAPEGPEEGGGGVMEQEDQGVAGIAPSID